MKRSHADSETPDYPLPSVFDVWIPSFQSDIWISVVQSDQTKALFAVLMRYFNALEDGTAEHLRPDPTYRWQHYPNKMTIERMRDAIQGVDSYLWDQRSYVSGQTLQQYDAGPEFNRLPDAALVALFQEIDTLFAAAPA